MLLRTNQSVKKERDARYTLVTNLFLALQACGLMFIFKFIVGCHQLMPSFQVVICLVEAILRRFYFS